MADMVDRSGLILTDWADNMAKAQAQQYLQVQRQRESEQYARQQSVQQASDLARQQFAGGNVDAARQTAAGGNAWDVWNTIDTDQKTKVAAQATDIGTAAFNLAKLPKGEARTAYFNSFVPTLKSHGMSDQEIAQYAHSGFLDDDNALAGYRDKAIGIKEMYDTEQTRIKDERAHEYRVSEDAAKPITAADGAVLVRGADGSLSPIYTPGSKPMQQIIKNEDGSSSYVNIPGTAGTSYAPGTGDKSRLMNYEARARGVAAVPDTVQNLGQFSDFASGLNRQGIKSSAAGDFQIVGDTMRRYAPRALGQDWRNQPFNSATQDRVAQAIFEDNNGSASALRKQWVSLSPQDAERIRTLPWSQARQVIMAGESSGGSAPQGAGPRPAGNGIETINLGGGRTGPLWKDETKNINGQNVSGQTNQQTGEFKPLGGAGKAAKPVDFDNDIASLNNTIGITERLYHHPGLSAVVGVPGLTGGLLGGKVLPGTDAAGFTSLMKNFDANAYLAQVTKMKGLGALSDAEGARLSAAIGSLSTSQSENEFKSNLAGVRKDLELARGRLVSKRDAMRSGGSSNTQAQTRVVNGRTYVKVAGGWKAQ